MRSALDYPDNKPVDAGRFSVRGWVWLGEAQAGIAAVEAWSGDALLGQTETLIVRPDVTKAFALSAEARTGFEFFADNDAARAGGDFMLRVKLRWRDGTRSEPLCERLVTTVARSGSSAPAAESGAGGAGVAGDGGVGGGGVDGAGAGNGETTNDAAGAWRRQLAEARATIGKLERELQIMRNLPQRDGAELQPPEHLQVRQVAGVWGSLFYSEGRVILEQVAAAFREVGRPLETAARVLDFGCGCGRALRNFEAFPHTGEIWGCDIDAEAIAWSRAHLGHVAQFAVNPTLPPAPFRDGFFEAIYSISVFTHLPEEMQFAWLTELRRLLKPGGVLVASVHGAHYWRDGDAGVKAEVESRGFAYRSGERTEGLPDFYMVAFHAEAYIRSRWSWFFEVVAIKERHIHGVHDAVILRRRDD